jgi:uncharacterized protein
MEKESTSLNIHVIPGSKINRIVGYMDDGTLKIRIKAKPTDGKANKELIKYLSEVLDIKEMDIEIFSGLTSRNKIIRIWGFDQVKMRNKIFEDIP